MRKLVVLVGLVALAGCAAQRQAQFNKDAMQCRAEIPAVVGNYVRRQQCIVDSANRAGFTRPGEGLLKATRIELAEKVDKGEMTVAEARARTRRSDTKSSSLTMPIAPQTLRLPLRS
jgi:hypothetical protein